MESKAQVWRMGGAGLISLFLFILQEICFAGMAVSPLQQTVEVKPGKITDFVITISNNVRNPKTQPLPIRVDILDFKVTDRGQLLFGPEYKNSRSAASWITLDANTFVLKPGESKHLKGTIKAPMNADGDYWAAAMIGLNEPQNKEKGVQVNLRTASGIFIHAAKRNYTERGEVNDVNITMPRFDLTAPKENAPKSEIYKFKQTRSLQIEAKLQNNGLVKIPARGKSYIYSENWKRIATIPLDAGRRQVLPGDSRWFTGVMSEPLPAGNYTLRTVFASDTKFKRKITKDTNFSISDNLAGIWSKNFVSDSESNLKFDPQQITLKLNPGRATSTNLQVANDGMNTIAANCRIEDNNTGNNWLELKTTDFTLAPNSSSSISFIIRVPSDVKPGTYNWNILIEMEKSGLEGQDKSEQYKIPVSIVIDENRRAVTQK